MKKVFWAIVLVAIIGFMMWSKDPLNDVVNFIVAGSIPRTQLSLGFTASVGTMLGLTWLVVRGLKNLHTQMLAHTAKQTETKLTNVSEEAEIIEFDRTKRSVIAAQPGNSVII